jgi:mycoredoxin
MEQRIMDNLDSNARLIVYGHNFCSLALNLERVLKRRFIDYEWRDVREGAPRFGDELRQLARGHLSVPTVVFPDGSVLVEPWPDEVLERIRSPRA